MAAAISTAVALALPSSGPTAPSWLMATANPPLSSPILIPQAITSVAQSAFSWMAAHQLQTVAGIVLGVPLLAALEAGYLLLRYRSEHGSAPCPITPSHGTVKVNLLPANNTFGDASAASLLAMSGRSLDPLRLLVIGDSLAAGVGTLASCTPLLPESLATSLSRDLGGRTVEWTVIGEPGASAGWITRTLEAFQVEESDGDAQIKNNKSNEKDVHTQTIEGWIRKQLVEDDDGDEEDATPYSSRTMDAKIGQYDVAVLLTGSNDLKFAVLPWMFRQQREEERTVENGDFAAELRNAVESASRKMKAGISESIDRVLMSVEEGMDAVRNSVEEALPEAVREHIVWSNITSGYAMRGGGEAVLSDTSSSVDKSIAAAESVDKPASDQSYAKKHQRHRPLVVLPALPAKVLPVATVRPLSWIAFPLLRIIENAKRKLSKLYPDSIVFVEAPRRSDFKEYMEERGPTWHQKELEGRIESSNDVNPFECRQTLHRMQEYSQEDGRKSPEPFLATDGIHPNDLGYDYWARIIASSIVEEWASSGCGACAASAAKAAVLDLGF